MCVGVGHSVLWRSRYVDFFIETGSHFVALNFLELNHVDQAASFRELKGARIILNLDIVGLGFKWNKRSYSPPLPASMILISLLYSDFPTLVS